MLSYADFHTAAPNVAAPLRARLEAAGLCLLATLRLDGSPRISPVEVTFDDDRLYVGMMPGSMKARDLQRDPRCALITAIADKHDLSGEGKLFAVAVGVDDLATIARIFAQAGEENDVDPETFAGSPVFELRVTGGAWQHLDGDTWNTLSWNEGHPVRHRRRLGPSGDVVEQTVSV